ncbi:hypothetical protein M0L66_001737 [Pseudomonas aeruginosa]|uniref:hypothetical protein n=1 Tax=Pseudomonas aeruginosa TaxID=287 RepID=UPI00117A99C7|nr:hypothetical protein [Pseudomonas aeruginosa]EKV0210279.1 hypothetical protein [Pseudomonas aeruginosa]EKX5067006.1 hypothetical protein [Pseudomonas aeruginosa]ELB6598668.1 hypothetical protein [Pseudomonas aeruginosa]ELH7225606.1 hypothetical protein [Pseudomonas aeruginosa]ELQ8314488.1 hypothetical protein [Pseudomonas aeruginosa]
MQNLWNAPSPNDLDNLIGNHLNTNLDATVVVQFSSAAQYSRDLLRRLDTLCARFGIRVRVRFYGHYSGAPFDARVLSSLPNVHSLDLDGLGEILTIETLEELALLKSLGVGVENFNLNSIVSLSNLQTLHRLRLSQQTGTKVDISPSLTCRVLAH